MTAWLVEAAVSGCDDAKHTSWVGQMKLESLPIVKEVIYTLKDKPGWQKRCLVILTNTYHLHIRAQLDQLAVR